jgi:hypothetical protein
VCARAFVYSNNTSTRTALTLPGTRRPQCLRLPQAARPAARPALPATGTAPTGHSPWPPLPPSTQSARLHQGGWPTCVDVRRGGRLAPL